MKCGISPGTAREKLRLVNALFDLSLTSGAFQNGELSYSRARSLTRVATPETADHYQVVVHVDEDAPRGAPDDKSKGDLPIETVRRLCCDNGLVVVQEDERGEPLNVDRKHRVVQPALRRALLARARL